MAEKEKLAKLISEAVNGCAPYWANTIADYLIANGVVILPVPIGSPCKIRKVICDSKKISNVEIEEATVKGVCILTESKSGTQIMTAENVFASETGCPQQN